MCKDFWGLNPDGPHPPVCEQRASMIDAEATAAVTPGTAQTSPSVKPARKEEQIAEGEIPNVKPEKKPIGSQFPAPLTG